MITPFTKKRLLRIMETWISVKAIWGRKHAAVPWPERVFPSDGANSLHLHKRRHNHARSVLHSYAISDDNRRMENNARDY